MVNISLKYPLSSKLPYYLLACCTYKRYTGHRGANYNS